MSQESRASEKPEVFGHPTLSKWVFVVGFTCGFLALVAGFALMIKGIVAGE